MDIRGYFRKKAIALKRNFYTIPFLLNVITLVIFSCSIYVHSQVAQRVDYQEANQFLHSINNLNAFFLFVIMLASILGTVAYLKYMGRIKNYFMLGVYYLLSIVQLVLEVFFYIGIKNQRAFETTREQTEIVRDYIRLLDNSMFLVILHIVFVVIALIVSSFAPLIQKYLKAIKFKRFDDGAIIENNDGTPIIDVNDEN